MLRDFRKNKLFTRRTAIIGGAQAGLISALIARLGYLQIFKYEEYSTKSDSNRIRPLIAPAPRGLIMDRNAKALTTNHHNYRLLLYTENKPDVQNTIDKLNLYLFSLFLNLKVAKYQALSIEFHPEWTSPKVYHFKKVINYIFH